MIGFLDETWWSRFAQPQLHAWSPEGQALRLVEQSKGRADPDPKALACYGLLVRWNKPVGGGREEQIWLRFVDGRPVSALTIQFLKWCCDKLAAQEKKALLLVWDNASWHVSRQVRSWMREHNRMVKQMGSGVRIVACRLPIKSPWLNPIESIWAHSKRRIVEPNRTLSARELADRVCESCGCEHEEHLSIPEVVPG